MAVTVSGLLDELGAALNKGDRKRILDTLQKLKPTKKPKSVADASSITKKVAESEPDNMVEYSSRLIEWHCLGKPCPPSKERLPKGGKLRCAFDKLKSAIYILDPFTYGEHLGDAQVNAECAAYALNYIASLSKRSVAIIGWSQGNIDARWAFKYWPSTRKATTDHVAISADCKGTALANFVGLSGIINTPSVVQQEAGSDFIKTLRSDGGDSGYVPTTSLHSSFPDEIVQPQQGTRASAYLLDERNVGVTNTEVQRICAGKPGGSFYTHESMLVNPLSFALVIGTNSLRLIFGTWSWIGRSFDD